MVFNENSAMVKIWVNNINTNKYTEDDIPKLFNLRDVVLEVLHSTDSEEVTE